jgi:lipid II:glycine glycyltransferase (peptidoglycan interpeptide bridge formation enzyme)
MMIISEITDKTKWNNFLLSQPTQTGIFLQSAEWLDFQEAAGHKTYRLGVVENGEITAICGVIKNDLPLAKKYFYCPRGPIMNQESKIRNQELLIEKILEIAKKESTIFLRIEPINKNLKSKILNLKSKSVQPERTLILDLTNSEDELLAKMHEKTRYNIRLAEKKNLVFKNGTIDDFWKLTEKTTARDKFSAHPKKYYETMLKNLDSGGKTGMRVELKIVYLKNTPIAAAIVGYFGDTATYLHGASSYEHRNLMAPYFLHWQIIKEAKNLGYKFYDFWGIDEKKWPGVTRFKKGFGGSEINYLGTFDLPIQKIWYKIYRLAKKFI